MSDQNQAHNAHIAYILLKVVRMTLVSLFMDLVSRVGLYDKSEAGQVGSRHCAVGMM